MDGRAASHTITDRLPFLMARGIAPVVVSAPTGNLDRRFPHYRVFSPAPSGLLFEMRQVIEKRWMNPFMQRSLKTLLTLMLIPAYVLEKLIIPLGSQWSWFFTGTIWALNAARRHQPVIVYSTAGPASTHVAGWLTHLFLGLPWVAEVHDPFIPDGPCRLSHEYLFNRWIECRIFRCADAIIYFTEKARREACNRHNGCDKVFVVRPGASPVDFGDVTYVKKGKMHFAHFGSLAKDRNLSMVIRSLHSILKTSPSWQGRLQLDVYGTKLDDFSRAALDGFPLGDVLVEHGRLEYDPISGKSGRQQVLEAMRCCDVLIILHGTNADARSYVPSKVYEYLQAMRPIVALTRKDTELAQILLAANHFIVDPLDDHGLVEVLKRLADFWEHDNLTDRFGNSPYTVQAAVGRLLEITDGVAPRSAST